MSTELSYKVITPERVVLEGQATALSVMTEEGEITILPGHIPLASLLRAGEMRIKTAQGEQLLAISTGLLQVHPQNQIVILADTAERSEELELSAIEEAKKKAEDALKNTRHHEEVAFANAAALLERELARYRVALKGKNRGR